MEVKRHGITDLDIGCIAENDSVGICGDGIAAFEDFQRAAFFELQG